MAKVMILNGAPRKNGNTAALVNAFTDGARSVGNDVKEFYIQAMEIHGCLGCDKCAWSAKGISNPCVQKDDMAEINATFMTCDVVVFASPVYFWTISGPLKTVTDRLYAELKNLGYRDFEKKSILLMTAGGSDFSQASRWYKTFEQNLGWTNLGEILGAKRTEAARKLGASI